MINMVIYKGPSTLRETVESVYDSIGFRFTRKNPKISVGLEHLEIDYQALGFSNENAYFARVDSLIEELNRLRKIQRNELDERAQALDLSQFNSKEEKRRALIECMEEKTDTDKTFWTTYDAFRSIADNHQVQFNRISTRTIAEISSDELTGLMRITKGGYHPFHDTIYFDPAYVFTLLIEDAEEFKESLIHECTHRELGDTVINNEKRGYYQRGRQLELEFEQLEKENSETVETLEAFFEQEEGKDVKQAYEAHAPDRIRIAKSSGLSEDQIGLLEKVLGLKDQYDECVQNLKRLIEVGKRLKLNAIDEGLAFAAANQTPDFPAYEDEFMIAQDYETAFFIFKDVFSKNPYDVVVQLAKNVINRAYRKNIDAIQILQEMVVEVRS